MEDENRGGQGTTRFPAPQHESRPSTMRLHSTRKRGPLANEVKSETRRCIDSNTK
ncbi:hypothetical protein WN48_00750 [Eufriesea mexicana]|uniref:Uncharacterized protein n=1 Tax=Eufriesea mexicana TaxID=516756 RepID=A0A310SGA8_9HYME|nr:hypothetical protein WN48_00750 [Eufriesea mexicana]